MDSISLKALAKINLGLDVTGVRENGYHDVRMIMQTIHLYDRIDIKRVRSPHIRVENSLFFIPVKEEDNLAYKAALLMKDTYQIKEGVRIGIQKYIPMAAGLGGGSADAAAVMVGMNKIFKLGVKQEELMQLGTKIGADVPFCILRGTALAEGIGEILTPLPPMPKCPVLIARPDVAVSTKEVYDGLKLYPGIRHPNIDGIIEQIKAKDLDGIAMEMGNILETVTAVKYPVINEIKRIMKENGAINAMMSGSGPSVFGLFRSEADVNQAYDALKQADFPKHLYTSEIQNSQNNGQNNAGSSSRERKAK